MSVRARVLFAAASLAVLGACADSATAPDVSAPAFAKSGSAPSGGGGGGGKSGGGKTGGGSTGGGSTGTVSGPPVAPSFSGIINAIGVVPTTVYYGTPSEWTIGGYVFEGNFFTHLKMPNGPLVVGACVSVTFSDDGAGHYIASEIKSQLASKCQG